MTLKLDTRNARRHSETNKRRIKQSLDAVGAGRSVLADADGIIRAGNGVFAEWGDKPVKIVPSDGTELVVVQRTDLRGKDAVRAAALDNIAADSSAYDYDAKILAEIAKDDALVAALAKEDAKLAELLQGDAKQEPKDAGELVDKAAELQKKWQVKRGDLWECGKHRILCGDSTNAADVQRLMGGEKAQLCLTDPPYDFGESYAPDNLDELIKQFLPLARANSEVVFLTPGNGNQYRYPIPDWTLCWFIPAAITRHAWGYCYWQPVIAYGKDPYLKVGKGARPDGFSCNRASEVNGHPDPKPIEVWGWFIERGSVERGAIVLDPFLGSGTTLVACEQTGRIGRGMEIEPKYVAVSLERLAGLGLNPQRIGIENNLE